MRKIKIRIICWILTALMVVQLVPVNALAVTEGASETEISAETAGEENTDVNDTDETEQNGEEDSEGGQSESADDGNTTEGETGSENEETSDENQGEDSEGENPDEEPGDEESEDEESEEEESDEELSDDEALEGEGKDKEGLSKKDKEKTEKEDSREANYYENANPGYRHIDGDNEVADCNVYPEGYEPIELAGTQPSSYRTPGEYMSPLRNQGSYGTCWAHSSMAMAEIGRMKNNGLSNLNYSEAHLAYFVYHTVTDPVGGLEGDSNRVLDDDYFNAGGNYNFSGYALMSWVGAADESQAPYSSVEDIKRDGLSDSLAYNDVSHLENHYVVDVTTNRDDVKQMIQQYGAVGANIYVFSQQGFSNEDAAIAVGFYNEDNNCYYTDGDYTTNHAVTLVGWDDNFSADNFTKKPSGNGAWLVRNSWSDGGDYDTECFYGYFWLSYYDKSLGEDVHCFEFTSADNYDRNYQYDGSFSGGVFYYNSSINDVKEANVFTAVSKEQIEAVAFYTSNTNSNYTVSIYKNLRDADNPESGELLTTQEGMTRYEGYYTVELEEGAPVEAGDSFSVVVEFEKAGCELYFDYESSSSNTDWFRSVAAIEKGQSFYTYYYGGGWSSWNDMADRGASGNLRIKAFTSITGEPVEPSSISFKDNIETEGVTIGPAGTFTPTLKVTPSYANKSNICWKSSDEGVATVTELGKVTGVSVGTAEITAYLSSDESVCASFTVNVVHRPSQIKITSDNEESYYYCGKEYRLSVVTYPEGEDFSSLSTEWSSSNEDIATVDEDGIVTVLDVGSVTISADVSGAKASLEMKAYIDLPSYKADVSDDNVVTLSWEASPYADSYLVTLPTGEKVTVSKSPLKDVYTYVDSAYKGTTENRTLTYSVGAVRNNTVLKFTKNVYLGKTYTITYHMGEGTNDPSNPTTYKSGARIELKAATPPEGYSFLGWMLSEDASTYYSNAISGKAENLDLYPYYYPNQYKVEFYGYYSATDSPYLGNYYYGTTYYALSPYSRTGYTFKYWTTNSDGTGTKYYEGKEFSNLTSVDGGIVKLYAQWDVQKYTVTFNSNGGSSVEKQTIEYNGKVTKPENPTKEGYNFVGWYSDSSLYSSWNFNTGTVTKTMTLYAKWEVKKCTVSFESNGGSSVNNRSVSYNTKVSKPTNPTKTGYSFIGWYKDEGLNEAWDFSTDVVTKNITLYAKWEAIKYTVSFYSNGGSSVASISVAHNGKVTKPSDPTKTGYSFAGWYTSSTLSTAWNFDTDTVTKVITLYAKWETIKYTVSFESNGGSAVTDRSVTYNSKVSKPVSPTRTGYTFAGWYKNEGLSQAWDFNTDIVTKDITLYAKWDALKYNVTFNSNGGSSVAGQTVEYDGKVTKPSDPVKEGCSFAGWYKNEGLTQVWDFDADVVTKAVTIYAKWETQKYTVSFESNGGSEVESLSVTYNEKASKPADPVKENHDFAGWYKNEGLTQAWDFDNDAVIAATTLFAKWEAKKYTVSFESNGGSEVESQSVAYSEKLTKPVDPEKKYHIFGGWYGNEELTQLWDFDTNVIAGPTTLFAKWKPVGYTVRFEANGGSNAPGQQSVAYGDKITKPDVSDMTRAGYVFLNWYQDEEKTVLWNFDTDTVTKDITLYADWKNEKGLWMKWEGKEFGDGLKITYENAAVKPNYEVYYGDRKLESGKDYTVAYKNNTNVNLTGNIDKGPQLIITGKGNYKGKVTGYFDIVPKDIGESDVYIETIALNYTGKVQKKIPSILWKGKAVPVKAPQVEYFDEGGNPVEGPKEEGRYTVKVTGTGNFCGVKETTINVVSTNAKDPNALILMSKFKATVTPFVYDGKVIDDAAMKEHIKVAQGKTVLEYGTDYKVIFGIAYNNVECKEIGTYNLTVRGLGKYSGEIKASFKINGNIKLSTAKFAAIPAEIYNGGEHRPQLTITAKDGTVLTEGEDYKADYENNISTGTAKVVITGIGKYYGTVNKNFKINALPIAGLDADVFSVEYAPSVSYEKSGVKPKVTVKYNGEGGTQLLKEGTDYSVAYANNAAVTTSNTKKLPTITITGKKNFSGKKIYNFSIAKANIDELTISAPDIQENAKAGKYMSTPTVTDRNGKNLAKKTDYDTVIVYTDKDGNLLDKNSRPVAGDIIQVTVKGVNNYQGTLTGKYRVYGKGLTINSASVKVRPESAWKLEYTGHPVILTESDLLVKVGKYELRDDEFEIIQSSYVNNVNKGTAKVTIVGKCRPGEEQTSYAGKKTISFAITQRNMHWWEW